jgi:hypothetical protein
MEPDGWALALFVRSVVDSPSLRARLWAWWLDALQGREVAESHGVTS